MSDRELALEAAVCRRERNTASMGLALEAAKLEADMKRIEARHMMEVTALADGGKPIYSNEQARKSAVAERVAEDGAYQTMERQVERMKQDAGTESIEADYQRDLIRVYVAFAEAEKD